MPDYRVTVVCGCGRRHDVALGSTGTCDCGRPYDTNKIGGAAREEIAQRAAAYRSRRRIFVVQLILVLLALLVIARTAPWYISVPAFLVSWVFFGWRGRRQLRLSDPAPTRYRI
jgi:hypothetical protein